MAKAKDKEQKAAKAISISDTEVYQALWSADTKEQKESALALYDGYATTVKRSGSSVPERMKKLAHNLRVS